MSYKPVTRLWFREKRERSYHALRRMADTKYMCGKPFNLLVVVEQDKAAISGRRLCAACKESVEGRR